MQVFKTKWFARYARREEISDNSLIEAIERAERGLIDADPGGELIKQRVARTGQGDPEGIESSRPIGQQAGLSFPRIRQKEEGEYQPGRIGGSPGTGAELACRWRGEDSEGD